MALRTRQPKPGLLHHSDRGVQYAGADYQEQLRKSGIVCSMSRKGDCWDNAVAESRHSSPSSSTVWTTSVEAAKAAIFEHIETFTTP
jgi:transposase InsO family protein